MKKILNYLANKALCAAFVVLGAASVSAEVVKTPIYNANNISVGYMVTGLDYGTGYGNEVAMVYTNHNTDANCTWTVPANLKNVEFLVVGGGGGGGGGTWGPGGGGGGVITGSFLALNQNDELFVSVGKGGDGAPGDITSTKAEHGISSKVEIHNAEDYILAYGGGGGRQTVKGTEGSGAGGPAGSKAGQYYVGRVGYGGKVENSKGLMVDVEIRGENGGASNIFGSSDAANQHGSGGGGGATAVGANSTGGGTSSGKGGNGGQGLASSITGQSVVYGSGGGAGGYNNNYTSSGKGGEGAGNGASNANSNNTTQNDVYATSALANQGGGGGGGGKNNGVKYRKGGNGGSGIVVFRYAYNFKAGDDYYFDFASAIEAATENGVIQMFNDDATNVELGKSVTLNLNEKNYTGTITLTDVNAVLTADKEVNVECGADYEVVEAVENGVYTYTLQVSNRTITLPEVKGATWSYKVGDGEFTSATENIITVKNGATVTLKLKVNDDNSLFADNLNEKTFDLGEVTVNKTIDVTGVAVAPVVATVNNARFVSLQAAVNAAEAGAEITVIADIVTDGPITVNKEVSVNLNNRTITAENDKSGDGVFYVVAGGELTLNGEGTVNAFGPNDYCMAIWADGGKVTINGGTYTNEGAKDDGPDGAHFDLIYAKNGSEVVINGGTFKCQTPNWTLNSHDTAKGTIVVNGGTFYQFNPANCATEGANTNFCADGLCGYVVETVDGVDVYGVAAAIAMVGDEMYPSFDAALEAAASGDTVKLLADVVVEKVVVVPAGATLDLNGKSIQALAVVGKLAMNGGALKTYDTNTQTNFFMAAPAGTAALYWTSDAVMTIGADYGLALEGGAVTLPASWRTLLKQTLTIKSGATFVIPQGVELNLRGNAVVEEGAMLTCNGTIALGNTLDAIDTSATLTSAQLAEGKVISAVEGYKVQYADGKYTLVKSGLDVTIGDDTFDTVEKLLAAANTTTTMTVTGNDWSTEGNVLKKDGEAYVEFADYYTVVINGTSVTLKLNKPVVGDSTEGAGDAFTVTAEEVTIKIANYNSALKYGVRRAADINGLRAAEIEPVTPTAGVIILEKAVSNSAFYEVVVSDVAFPEAE